MDTYIHVGIGRSGSTWLQSEYFPQLNDTLLLGKCSASGDMSEELTSIKAYDGLFFDEGKAASDIKRYIEENVGSCRRVVYSDEGLTSHSKVDRRTICGRLKSIFPDAKIIIVLREQRQMLKSTFLYLMRSGTFADRNFSDWIKKGLKHNAAGVSSPVSRIYYKQLIDAYVEVFGKENVGLFLFEEIFGGPNPDTRKLSKFLMAADPKTDAQSKNASRSSAETAARNLRYKIFGSVPIGLFVPSFVRSAYYGTFSGGNPPALRIEPCIERQLNELCSKENNGLLNCYGMNIDKFGYILEP